MNVKLNAFLHVVNNAKVTFAEIVRRLTHQTQLLDGVQNVMEGKDVVGVWK